MYGPSLKSDPKELQKSTLLLVEDEEQLSSHILSLFEEAGFNTFQMRNFKDLELFLDSPDINVDIIVLDRLLHGKDSSQLIPKMKLSLPNARIIILSAINSTSEKVNVLNAGADDYLSKPFESEELIARIRVLLRKSEPLLSYGNIVLNVQNRTLKIGSTEESLPNKEFTLLQAMVKNPRKVFTKTDFYVKVWGMSSDVDSNVVETTINKIRKRLEEVGSNVKIRNKRNIGYWVEE